MRQDFRLQMDFSKFYEDSRKNSWIYVDSTKIFFINQLAQHVKTLFDIQKPFHFLSRFNDTNYFLPFEEDVRVLENNDRVLVVPGTGFDNSYEVKNYESTIQNHKQTHVDLSECEEKESNVNSEKSCFSGKATFLSEKSNMSELSQKSSIDHTIDNGPDRLSIGSLYRTALHTTINDTKDSKMTDDNFTEDNSITEDSQMSSLSGTKRKRVRKRKSKKSEDIVPESDASLMELSGKKPRVVDSILISSGKHIRFQGIDDDNNESSINNGNYFQSRSQNGNVQQKSLLTQDLAKLLKLRQSSTPLTFAHKRLMRESDEKIMNETEINMDTSDIKNQPNSSLNVSPMELDKTKENSQVNKSTVDNDTYSFKIFKIGEDYTPQLSSVILAKVLSTSEDGSHYTMKILHGKEELQEPDGKFALPKDEEDENGETNDIITLEKSNLIDLTKVKAI